MGLEVADSKGWLERCEAKRRIDVCNTWHVGVDVDVAVA